MRALVADFEGGEYGPVVRTISTLEDASALVGEAAALRGLGDISLVVPVDIPDDVGAYRDAMLVDAGGEVRPRWANVDGALYPRDFDAFALTTMYHHLERAQAYFAGLGASLEDPLDVYYLPFVHMTIGSEELALTDNALYFFGVRFLAVTRFDLLQTLPLGMNRGVVIHEYGHAIFDELVYDDAARLQLLSGRLADRTANHLRSTTEALSDFFAAAETGDPDFIRWSVDEELMPASRDLSLPVIYDEALLETADVVPEAYDPYVAGSALASALWRIDVDRTVLARALVEAQRAFGQRLRDEPPWSQAPDDFGFAWLLDPFVLELETDQSAAACAVFEEQLPAAAIYMSTCQ
ncbi:MAG: hypothetical protein HYY06_14395 [Deltaproteobacteria bacterium]|nr:hypothetical protein [Deltaproteobacteria bacterium]